MSEGDDEVEYVKSTSVLPPVAVDEGEEVNESWGTVVNEKSGQFVLHAFNAGEVQYDSLLWCYNRKIALKNNKILIGCDGDNTIVLPPGCLLLF